MGFRPEYTLLGDILRGEIHELDTERNKLRTLAVGDMMGTISLCNDGHYLAALKSGIVKVNRQSGALEKIAPPEIHKPGNRYNEGKCDPQGRLCVGSISLKEEPNQGRVYRLDASGVVNKTISNVTTSNGTAWSLDQQFFIT